MTQSIVRLTDGFPPDGGSSVRPDSQGVQEAGSKSTSGPPARRSLFSPLHVTLMFAIVVLASLVFIATQIVGPMDGPLLGITDVNMTGYTCYYFTTNLSFIPYPHLQLITDSIFYPYGINAAFQPWTLELNYFYALMFHLVGNGPWVQWYFLFTLAASAFGTYFLLKSEYSPVHSAFAGFAAAFACYAVIGKFPLHISFACVHWPLLNLVADHLSLRRFWDRRDFSVRWLLLRGLILLGVLGCDPSYVAGIAITSFVLATGFIVIGWWYRHVNGKGLLLGLADLLDQIAASARIRKKQSVVLLAMIGVLSFLYLPILLEVVAYTKRIDMTGTPFGGLYASPLRLLVPLFPIYNISVVTGAFHDTPETLFTWNAGIFFVLLILISAVLGWREWGIMAPPLFLVLIVAANHPNRFPILNYFPWFTFMRMSSRFTMIFPWTALLVSFCIPPRLFKTVEGRLCLYGMLILFSVEMFTAYQIQLSHPDYFMRKYFRPDANFYKFMETVKAAPGEAVFEFPFCIAGGTGNVVELLGRYYGKQDTIFSLKQFHTKKIVGQYFGRLSPAQVAPFINAGWDKMFFPDRESPWESSVQRRDFNSQEWEFFDQFFKLNDFCGMIIYTDFLRPQTVKHLRELYGEPTATTYFSTGGNMIFIPKPASMRALVNLEKGKALVLRRMAPELPANGLVDFTLASGGDYLDDGWAGLEAEARWAMGPTASFHCQLPGPGRYRVQFRAATFGKQAVAVEANGKTLLTFQGDGYGNQFSEQSVVVGPESLDEKNVLKLVFRFPDARTPQSVQMGNDIRVLGCRFQWLKVTPE